MNHLDEVDYKLNALKMNILMEQNFVSNMLLLKEWQPELYAKLRNHEPEIMKLGFGQDKILNLYDVAANVALYPGDPEAIAEKQVNDFLENIDPITLETDRNVQKEGIYTDFTSAVYRAQEHLGSRGPEYLDRDMPFVMMLGGGLGLQLQYLLNARDVKRLFYFEPHLDAFHASLHVIDWRVIKEYFDRDGYDLKLKVGEQERTLLLDLKVYGSVEGTFNLLYAYIYAHYNSPETLELAETIRRDFSKVFYGFGYYDDERVGLAHTVGNCEADIPVGIPSQDPVFHKTAAVVVGNGPSLDDCLPVLQAHRDNLVVISCGSTLGTLFAHGIKPDIHVEQERVALVLDVVKECADADFRDGIRFVGLNPVLPEVFGLFEQSGMLLKPNDIGADLIEQHLFDDPLYVAYYCNPTVTNTGVTLASLFNFGEVYLAGIDCGFVDPEVHHASGGWYENNLGEKTQKKLVESFSSRGDIVREGNFRPEVFTTVEFDNTRVSIEEVIKLSSEHMKFYNLNDGVRIAGAEPKRPDDVVIAELDDDKNLLLNRGFDLFFSKVDRDKYSVRGAVDKAMQQVPEVVKNLKDIYIKPVANRADIIANLTAAHKVIVKQYFENRLVFELLAGSVEACNTLVNMGCFARRSENMLQYYKACTEAFCRFLDGVDEEVRQDPYGETAPEKGVEVLNEFRCED